MTAMILTPDQARAVVGEAIAPADAGDILGSLDRAIQLERQRRRLARFIPAATADGWPVGKWIEVQVEASRTEEGSDNLRVTTIYSEAVGRVRLGEPVQVGAVGLRFRTPRSEPVIEASTTLLFYWPANSRDCELIARPHLDLFPDAWQPGSWAYPITDREATT